ncbi:PLP-dependent aminotransferase family protein [Paenibacillus pinihumi]|uniref:aminotransferase-like domain-containing protein n=1 Tax=Paenibacillus pinihumi TaxID=669462 RepID=UPI0004106B2A|nr:PLP-dependent aminotransferase family protein [Paenibacillus pinihumi]
MSERFSSRLRPFPLTGPGWPGSVQPENVISFAGSQPASDLLELSGIHKALSKIQPSWSVEQTAHAVFGEYLPLREQLCGRMARLTGLTAKPEQLLPAACSLTALELVIRILTEPGDTVLVGNPASADRLRMFEKHGLKAIPAACDRDGVIIASARAQLEACRPRLMYVMPTCSGPEGHVWSRDRKKGLLGLAHEFGLPVIEDDTCRELIYKEDMTAGREFERAGERDTEQSDSLLSLEGRIEGGQVIYLGALPGMEAAGLGLPAGWIAADSKAIGMIVKAQQAVNDCTPLLAAELELSRLLKGDTLDEAIKRLAAACRTRIKRAEELLASCMPEAGWLEPQGGMFLWLELPEGLDAQALQRAAIRQGVDFQPGSAFYAGDGPRNTVRLNICGITDAEMEEGIRRLAEAVGEFTARS